MQQIKGHQVSLHIFKNYKMHIFRESDKFIFANFFALERFLELVTIPYLAECTKYKWRVCFLQGGHLFSIIRNSCV